MCGEHGRYLDVLEAGAVPCESARKSDRVLVKIDWVVVFLGPVYELFFESGSHLPPPYFFSGMASSTALRKSQVFWTDGMLTFSSGE